MTDTYKSARNGNPGNAFTPLLQVATASTDVADAGSGVAPQEVAWVWKEVAKVPRKWRGSGGRIHPRDEEMLGRYQAILPAQEENDPRKEVMLGKYEAILPAREENDPREEVMLGKYEAILPAQEENDPREEEMLGKYEATLPAREVNDPREEEMLGKDEATLPAREERRVPVDKALSVAIVAKTIEGEPVTRRGACPSPFLLRPALSSPARRSPLLPFASPLVRPLH